MKQTGKKINGNADMDSPQMAEMRQTVIEQELSARSWKAFYEKMYYSLECEKLEPEYKEYQERAKKRIEEERAKMEAFMSELKVKMEEKNAADPAGNIELTEEN